MQTTLNVSHKVRECVEINNCVYYTPTPPKRKRIVLNIYRDGKRRGLYLALFTDPEGKVVLVFTNQLDKNEKEVTFL